MTDQPRVVHRDVAGRQSFSYRLGEDDGRPAAWDIHPVGRRPGPGFDADGARAADVIGTADAVEAADAAGAADGAVADAIMADLGGWVVSSGGALGDRLAARGAMVRRRFEILERNLATDPPPASWAEADLGPGRRAVPAVRPAADLVEAWYSAYPQGHPDAYPGTKAAAVAERLVPMLAGAHGPVLPSSRLVVDSDDRVVAGAIVIDAPGIGPVVGDVFRAPGPGAAGVGAALLRRVMAAAAVDGVQVITLSVSAGNPGARRVYLRLGYTPVGERVTISIPGGDDEPAQDGLEERGADAGR